LLKKLCKRVLIESYLAIPYNKFPSQEADTTPSFTESHPSVTNEDKAVQSNAQGIFMFTSVIYIQPLLLFILL